MHFGCLSQHYQGPPACEVCQADRDMTPDADSLNIDLQQGTAPGVRQRSYGQAPKKIVRCDGSCARCDSDQCALPMGHRDPSICYCSGCLQYESDGAALQQGAVNGCIGEPWTICAELKGVDFAAARSYGRNSFWMQASARLGQFLVGLVAFFYLRPPGSKALRR